MTPELNKIYQGDCVEIMRSWPDDFVDLTVTSPPYDSIRDYKGFNFDAANTLSELFRITRPGGVCVWVVGDQVIDGSESLTSFKQAIAAVAAGFRLHDTMIYHKNGFQFPEHTRYQQVFEYMFVFSKGKPSKFNPIKRPTKWGGVTKKNTAREKDGSMSEYTATFNDDVNLNNVWNYEIGYMKSAKDPVAFEHPAIFPEKLPADHIQSWTDEGDVVFDPFSGSGTTTLAAERLRRRWLGCEMSAEYIGISTKRMANEISQGKMF